MGPITYIAAGSTLALVVMTGLYLDKRDDFASAVANCNASKLESIAIAERQTREVLSFAHEREKLEWIARTKAADLARDMAEKRAAEAVETTANREEKIRQLSLEASTDEIPDSKECLNVFVPRVGLDWVQLYTGNCGEASAGGSTRPDEVCSDTREVTGEDSSYRDLSDITFSDSLILWGRDRDTVQILNGRLTAIESLSDQVAGQE